MATLPTIEPEGQAKLRANNTKQRQSSGKPLKPKTDVKRSEILLSDENKRLQEKVEELTAKLEESQNERNDDKRKKWKTQGSSEAEFLLEEQRINERESFEKQIAEMQERMDVAESRLEGCRTALESAGINGVNLERVEALKFEQIDDIESKTKAIGEEIFKQHEHARSLLSSLENMFNDDLDSLLEAMSHTGNDQTIS